MLELALIVLGLLAVSFMCSVLEAVILSITRPYIQLLIERKSRTGEMLNDLKKNIEEPISAILTLNTISHTVGAAVAGAIAVKIFGSAWMGAFSAVLTLLILIFSEIIPKTLGAHYWKALGPCSAYILRALILILKPLIVPIHFISRCFSKENSSARVSKGEIFNYIKLGYFQGVIDTEEFEIIENLFNLRSVRVRDIMTPRTVVYWLPPEKTLDVLEKEGVQLQFSRILLYNPDKNFVEGIVLRREIMNRITKKKTRVTLRSLGQKPLFIIETISVYKLLNHLVSENVHIAVVLNEYGDFVGVVTMEDAIETLLGQEIVDEYDKVEDMRKLAGRKKLR